jgi:hypothetical protein
MVKECLVFSFMRLGVPFIAPRQLGSVESNPGRQFLPSVDWCTGHCPVQISFLFWHSRSLTIWSRWRTGHCPVHTGQSCAPIRPLARPRVTRGLRGRPLARPTVGSPHSPVLPSDRWLGHASRADCAADRWLGRPLAHRTVRCTTG